MDSIGTSTAVDPNGEGLPRSADAWHGAILPETLKRLVRRHIEHRARPLFKELTGVRFEVVWAPALPLPWDVPKLAACCCANPPSPEKLSNQQREECERCAERRLAQAISREGRELRFRSCHGYTCFWLPLVLENSCLGILIVRNKSPLPPSRAEPPRRPRSRGFAHSIRVLRLVAHDALSTAQAMLERHRRQEVSALVSSLVDEDRHLKGVLARLLDCSTSTRTQPRLTGPVQNALDAIRKRYSEPLTVAELARELGMNQAYLSHLFAITIGVPFKQLLTAYRISIAEELLRDRNQRVFDVAVAVGFRSHERFRAAFKQATGISPREWRTSRETARELGAIPEGRTQEPTPPNRIPPERPL